MMSDNQLSHNDPDLKLAQAIGRARKEGTSVSGSDDSLLPPLLEYRQRIRRRQRGNKTGKQQVWQQVAESTEPAAGETAIRRLFSQQVYRWAAAAVILIGILFSVFYFQSGQQPKLLAKSGTSIKRIQLKEGSTVTLRPHSKLFKVKQSASLLLYKLKGQALFEVTPKQHRTFSVKTEHGRVSVLGTRFILSSWGNRMRVYLAEGSVKVQSLQQGNAVMLEPGEAATVNATGNITLIHNADSREFTDWLDHRLIFNSEPVEQIVRELEQQYNISIALPEKIANAQLTGQLSLENLQVALNDLSLVLGGTFVRTGKRSYKFEDK